MEQSALAEAQIVESLHTIGTIKKAGLEEYVFHKTESKFFDLFESIYKNGINNIYTATASGFTTHLFMIIVLWSGSYLVIQRDLTVGELLSFYTLAGYITGPAVSLIGINRSVQDALIAADRLFEIFDLDTDEKRDYTINLENEIIGNIRFQNLHFRYGTRKKIFDGLTFEIEKGKTTAVVGESGSGKSTLCALLQHLYPLQAGSITIGGIDIKYINNKSLRKKIAVVPQQIDLFAASFIENISVGDPEPDIPKVFFLTKLVGLDQFIEELPMGYNSLLGEQGTNLSGGQKQRMAIARALYRDPEILILDEATSSLDPVNEQKIQEAIAWYRQHGKTVIIIAHRLTTIRNSDQIIVLHKGELVEAGTHDQLIGKDGHYQRMWNYHANVISM